METLTGETITFDVGASDTVGKNKAKVRTRRALHLISRGPEVSGIEVP